MITKKEILVYFTELIAIISVTVGAVIVLFIAGLLGTYAWWIIKSVALSLGLNP